MSFPFDAVLKEIVGNNLAGFQAAFSLPDIQPAEVLNVDLSTLSAATDVAISFGTPAQEIVDLTFQSGPDANVEARLLLYNAALYLKHKVPVRSILVLLRPKADTGGLDGRLVYSAGNKRVQFEYDVIRLWEQPPDGFLSGGSALLPLAILCQMPKDRPLADALRDLVRKIDQTLAKEGDQAFVARLMTAAYILAGMRIDKRELGAIFVGVKIMHESTAYDTILDEGRVEGRVEGQLKMLLLLGGKHFGTPDARTSAALGAIQDLDRLERMAEAFFTAKSWDDLLAIP